MRLNIDLQLPADARFLPKTRKALAGYLEGIVVEPDVIHDVILALDEACANVIRHAFPGQSHATYRVQAALAPDQVEIWVEDQGVGFDPARLEVPMESIDLEALSGRGLSMIRGLMSDVEVVPASSGHGTCLHMRRDLVAHPVPHPATR